MRRVPCSNLKGFITSNSTTKISFFLREKETESFCLLDKKKKDVTSKKRIRHKKNFQLSPLRMAIVALIKPMYFS